MDFQQAFQEVAAELDAGTTRMLESHKTLMQAIAEMQQEVARQQQIQLRMHQLALLLQASRQRAQIPDEELN